MALPTPLRGAKPVQLPLAGHVARPVARSPLGSVRMFLALMPGARTQRAIARWCDTWQWSPEAVRTRPERLHLTLHFLGNVPAPLLPMLRTHLHVNFDPFVLRFGAASLWNQGTAVLEPLEVPVALVNLHAALLQALRRCGARSQRGAFRPHITLARNAQGSLPPDAPLVLARRITEYALIRSDLQPPATYHVEQVFTL